jgi:hypothetical protein
MKKSEVVFTHEQASLKLYAAVESRLEKRLADAESSTMLNTMAWMMYTDTRR